MQRILVPIVGLNKGVDTLIRKRGDNTWQIVIYLGRINGKKKYYYETYYSPRKSIVQDREKELEKQLKIKTGPNQAVSTVGELLFFWVQNLEDINNAEERTIETYRGHIKRILPVVGDLQLYNLTAFKVQEALNGEFKDVSGRTRKNYYSTLRTALRRGYSWGLLPHDVTTGIIIPEVEIPEKEILSFDQLELLLNQTQYKHYLIVRMLVVSGARLSEILGLRWVNVDFETGKIKIIKTVDSRNRETKDKTKTKSSKRNIILDKETLEYLQKKKQSIKVISIKEDERLVFNGDDGRPMRHRAVELTLHRMLKKAGLPKMGLHSLRHSVLTNLNDVGISIADIIALSGHAGISSLQPYIHQTKTGLNILDTITLLNSQSNSQSME